MTKSNDKTLPPSTHNRTFYSAYSPKRRVTITFPPTGKTQQSHKDDCDINVIMARYQQTGLIDHFNQRQPRFIDCTGADYHAAQQLIAQAKSMFQDLPSSIRNQFDNDPAAFLDFVQDPANAPRLAEMGLTAPQPDSGHPPTGQPAATPPTPQSAAPQPASTPPSPQPAQGT